MNGAFHTRHLRRLLFIISICWILLTTVSAPTHTTGGTSQPNIIVIMTDDQRYDTMRYVPFAQQNIQQKGLNFTSFFVDDSLCCPSRSSFLTGNYTHNHGVWTNSNPDGFTTFTANGNDKHDLPVWLHSAGYYTGLVGKYLNGYIKTKYIPPGWDYWAAFNGAYYNYTLNVNGVIQYHTNLASDYSTDVLAAQAVKFIQTAHRPFFLDFTPYSPHKALPFDSMVAPRYLPIPTPYPHVDATLFPSYNETDYSDKVLKIDPIDITKAADIDNYHIHQIYSMKALDDAVSTILVSLGSEISNTVIIYTSDNGVMWGEHRIVGKDTSFEESIKVPLIIRWDQVITAPRTTDALAVNIDLPLTIADMAGATVQGKTNGVSLLPIIQNTQSTVRNDFLTEMFQPNNNLFEFGVRTNQYKLIDYYFATTNTNKYEFYDLSLDPYEMNSQYSSATYASVIATLQARLAELRSDTPIAIATVTNSSPRWGIDVVSISGGVTNSIAGDTVTADWGDGTTTTGIPTSGGLWGPVPHTYGSGTSGTTLNIVATLRDGSNGIIESSPPVVITVQKHATSVALGNIINVRWSMPTSFPATLTDTDNGGTAISSRTIHYDGTGVIAVSDATTNSTGVAVGQGTAPSTVGTGWTVQAHLAGDALYKSADSVIKTYSTLMHLTVLTLKIAPDPVAAGATYSVSGVLKDSTAGGIPMSSRTIHFVTNNTAVSIPDTTTDSSGAYAINGLIAPSNLPSGTAVSITATFAGEQLYAAKSTTKVLTIS